jgi:hypothetical protein
LLPIYRRERGGGRGYGKKNANGVGIITFYFTLWEFPLERNCYIIRRIPAFNFLRCIGLEDRQCPGAGYITENVWEQKKRNGQFKRAETCALRIGRPLPMMEVKITAHAQTSQEPLDATAEIRSSVGTTKAFILRH